MHKLSFLTLLLLSSLFLTAERCSDSSTEEFAMPDSFYGSWIHSHEEDFEGNTVYRRTSFAFPPSRGRERFDLRPSGELLYYNIAPADGQAEPLEGSWEPLRNRMIDVEIPGDKANSFSAELIEVAHDRLVLKKSRR